VFFFLKKIFVISVLLTVLGLKVVACLLCLGVRSGEHLAAFSAHDFAGPRGGLNTIQVL
jgi:hypothetical protein